MILLQFKMSSFCVNLTTSSLRNKRKCTQVRFRLVDKKTVKQVQLVKQQKTKNSKLFHLSFVLFSFLFPHFLSNQTTKTLIYINFKNVYIRKRSKKTNKRQTKKKTHKIQNFFTFLLFSHTFSATKRQKNIYLHKFKKPKCKKK